MNNIKIKLKWKLTLFTVLIMTITSGILVFLFYVIYYNINLINKIAYFTYF